MGAVHNLRPNLRPTREDVIAAIAYGAEVARERIAPIAVERVA